MQLNFTPIINKMGQHFSIVAVSLTLLIPIVNISLHWSIPQKSGVMNSSLITINASGNVADEESIHNPMKYIKQIVENNHQYNPLFPFGTPFRLIVAGPSGAGKTQFVQRLIRESSLMMWPPPDNITWFYAET